MERVIGLLALTPFFAGRPMLASFFVALSYAAGLVTFGGSKRTPSQAVPLLAVAIVLVFVELLWKRVNRWTRSVAQGNARCAALLQIVPFVGVVVNPLAILIRHSSHRASLVRASRRHRVEMESEAITA